MTSDQCHPLWQSKLESNKGLNYPTRSWNCEQYLCYYSMISTLLILLLLSVILPHSHSWCLRESTYVPNYRRGGLCDFLMWNQVFAIMSHLCIFLHHQNQTYIDIIQNLIVAFHSSDISLFRNYCSDREFVRHILLLSLVWYSNSYSMS